MSTPIIEDLSAYWDSVGVERFQLPDLPGTPDEFTNVMRDLGLPLQSWWLFQFHTAPSRGGENVTFGSLGSGWPLIWRASDGHCLLSQASGDPHIANQSFLLFSQFLVLFDRAYRRVQTECPGDSGEDWAKGDLILASLEKEMRALDPLAFSNEWCLWPYLLVEVNG